MKLKTWIGLVAALLGSSLMLMAQNTATRFTEADAQAAPYEAAEKKAIVGQPFGTFFSLQKPGYPPLPFNPFPDCRSSRLRPVNSRSTTSASTTIF